MHQRKAPVLTLEHPEHFGAVIWLAEYELRQVVNMEMPQRLYDFAVRIVADLDADGPPCDDVELDKRSHGEDETAPQDRATR